MYTMYVAFLNYFKNKLLFSPTVYLSSVRLSYFFSLSLGLYSFDIDIGDKDYENDMVSKILI